jgi:integrase
MSAPRKSFAVAIDLSWPDFGRSSAACAEPVEPRHDLKKIWSAICRRCDLAFASTICVIHSRALGAGSGMGLPIVDKLLGHTQPSTTARYAHLDNDPVRRASESIGRTISTALNINET